MRGLDDGPDGLNDAAWERALNRLHRKAQPIPTIRDADHAAAELAVAAITFDTKLSVDMATTLHRWCCATCNRKGVWLASEASVRINATAHATWHATGEP